MVIIPIISTFVKILNQQLLKELQNSNRVHRHFDRVHNERSFRHFLIFLLYHKDEYQDIISSLSPLYSSEIINMYQKGKSKQCLCQLYDMCINGSDPINFGSHFSIPERKTFLNYLSPFPEFSGILNKINLDIPTFSIFATFLMYCKHIEQENEQLKRKFQEYHNMHEFGSVDDQMFIKSKSQLSSRNIKSSLLNSRSSILSPKCQSSNDNISNISPKSSNFSRAQTPLTGQRIRVRSRKVVHISNEIDGEDYDLNSNCSESFSSIPSRSSSKSSLYLSENQRYSCNNSRSSFSQTPIHSFSSTSNAFLTMKKEGKAFDVSSEAIPEAHIYNNEKLEAQIENFGLTRAGNEAAAELISRREKELKQHKKLEKSYKDKIANRWKDIQHLKIEIKNLEQQKKALKDEYDKTISQIARQKEISFQKLSKAKKNANSLVQQLHLAQQRNNQLKAVLKNEGISYDNL